MDDRVRRRTAGAKGRVAYTAALLIGAAIAPTMPAFAQGATTAGQRAFAVSGGSLSSALLAFGNQAGLQVSYVPSIARSKVSSGAEGSLTPEGALTRILAGTGLVYHFTDAATVTIEDGRAAQGTAEGAVSPDEIELEPIYVTGTGSTVSGGVPDAPDQPYRSIGSTSFVTAEQLDRFRGISAGDLLKSTPGVIAAGNHNGASLGVNIRGMQAMNRVKVTIDGTEQTTSTWRGYLGADDRTYIDQDLIASIGIAKGPSGGAEGAGAIGGVVAFRTLGAKDIVEEGKSFGARLRLGTHDNAVSPRVDSFDQSTDAPGVFDFENGWGNVALATTQENYDLFFAVAKRRSGNYFAGENGPSTWRPPGRNADVPLSYTKPGEEVFNTSSDTESILAKATFRPTDDQSIEFGFSHYDATFGEAIGSLLTMQDTTWRQTLLADANVESYNVRYRWDPLSELIDLRANAFATNVEASTVSIGPALYFPPWLTPETRPPAQDRRFSETWTYGVNASNTSRVETGFGGLALDYGGSYTLEDTNGEPYLSGRAYWNDKGVLLQPSIGTREIAGLFTRAEYTPLDWLKINAGLRYDHFAIDEKGPPSPYGVYADKEGGRLNPTLGVTLEPVSGLQFYGLYAEGFRPPSLRESIHSDSTLAPNPELQPEIARNWEFGTNVSMENALFEGDKAGVKAAYFINTYDDYISRVQNPKTGPLEPGEQRPFYSVANIDKASFTGLELSGTYDAGVFFAEGALTYYTDFEFCDAGKACSSGTLTSDYALNHMMPEISTSLTLGVRLFNEKLTVGGRVLHNGARLGGAPAVVQQTNYWLPYTVFDAFVDYKIHDNVTLNISGENLTDRYYIDALNGWLPSPGRTIRASLTAQF
jgi:hemoglobin/transferrin/lactoferrin receptor protein